MLYLLLLAYFLTKIQFIIQFIIYSKVITWNYTKYFSCYRINVLYIILCCNCDEFPLGQAQDLKQRIRKQK